MDGPRRPTAAVTRWRVTALPSALLPVPGVGRARWLVELIRSRAGECAEFLMDACDAQGRFALASDLVDRSASPADEPLVLLGREGRRRVVTAADRAALPPGLRVGMVATQATAMLPALHHHDARPSSPPRCTGCSHATRSLAGARKRIPAPGAALRREGLIVSLRS
jgi:hypothetical protein